MLEVIRIITGILDENCYVIHNNRDALIIDPGSDSEEIIKEINNRNLNVKGILITHYHFDHIGALNDIKKEYNIEKVYDFNLNDNQEIGIFKFKIIHNPGHTKDSVSFYFDKDNILFSGDFIFKDTIGKYDIENEKDMKKSLNIIKYLPKETVIYPGHGEDTTVLYELKNNPFLRGI